MSRIGKKPIEIPDKVEVSIEENNIKIKGNLGELALEILDNIKMKKQDNLITLEPSRREDKTTRALWGLYRSLISNMVVGVSEGFEKKLQIEGVGYKAEMQGKEIVLNLGYSHPIIMEIPEGLKVGVEKKIVSIFGIDKQLVGQFAAEIRSKRKPEPYKGKGIRYVGEHVRRKAGKRAVAGAT